MIIKVTQKVVSLEDCVYDIDVLNKIHKEIGSAYVVKYSVSPKNIVFYVEEHGSQFTIDMEVETQTYVLAVIAGYELLEKFPNAFKKAHKIGECPSDEIDNPVVAEQHNDVNGEINKILDETKEFLDELKDKEQKPGVSKIAGTQLIEGIMSAFDDIENDREVPKISNSEETKGHYKSQQEQNTEAMKELLTGLQDVGADFESMAEAVKIDVYGESSVALHTNGNISISSPTDIAIIANNIVEEDLFSDEDLKAMTIGDTVTETIQLKVALISFSAFDEYASKHNVVGWDLHSPTTLLIKYMEDGVTSSEKLAKFHETMDNLSPAWVEKTNDNVKFFTELHKVYDRDLVEEFLTRVKKHNVFVRESTAKIRAALLDMEKDFEALKDEINLSIDWEKLTAFAAKKERTEHRIKGVEMVFSTGDKQANVVKITSKFVNEEFYVPVHMFNNDIREKYTYDDELLFIEDVPNFAFYEVLVNGHVMLIEKTDL